MRQCITTKTLNKTLNKTIRKSDENKIHEIRGNNVIKIMQENWIRWSFALLLVFATASVPVMADEGEAKAEASTQAEADNALQIVVNNTDDRHRCATLGRRLLLQENFAQTCASELAAKDAIIARQAALIAELRAQRKA